MFLIQKLQRPQRCILLIFLIHPRAAAEAISEKKIRIAICFSSPHSHPIAVVIFRFGSDFRNSPNRLGANFFPWPAVSVEITSMQSKTGSTAVSKRPAGGSSAATSSKTGNRYSLLRFPPKHVIGALCALGLLSIIRIPASRNALSENKRPRGRLPLWFHYEEL